MPYSSFTEEELAEQKARREAYEARQKEYAEAFARGEVMAAAWDL